MKSIFLLLIMFGLSSCQSTGTKIIEEFEIPQWQLKKVNSLKKEFQLDPKASRIDSRPYFLYKMSHIEGSHHMSPSDFFIKQSDERFQLANRHYFQARRLSRYGIDIDEPVIVFGAAKGGEGEEWLMALYLEYLGVKKVEAVSLLGQGLKESNRIPVLPASRATWKPKYQKNLIASANDMKSLKSQPVDNVVVIDVRDSSSYLSSNIGSLDSYQKVNIYWKEFIDDNSRPNSDLFRRLLGLGLHPKKRILCVGEKPSHSATACMVLRKMGFVEAGIFLK